MLIGSVRSSTGLNRLQVRCFLRTMKSRDRVKISYIQIENWSHKNKCLNRLSTKNQLFVS